MQPGVQSGVLTSSVGVVLKQQHMKLAIRPYKLD